MGTAEDSKNGAECRVYWLWYDMKSIHQNARETKSYIPHGACPTTVLRDYFLVYTKVYLRKEVLDSYFNC